MGPGDRGGGLVLFGAYRQGDVGEGHPLPDLLAGLAAKKRTSRQCTATDIELSALRPEAVTELIADTLRVSSRRAQGLAAALAGRSDNNPLLIRQLLLFLADENLLERGPHGWRWSDEAVRRAGIPDDVAEVLKAKLARLPRPQWEVLVAASSVGGRFDVASLAAALEAAPVELYPQLTALCEQGLLAQSGDTGSRPCRS